VGGRALIFGEGFFNFSFKNVHTFLFGSLEACAIGSVNRIFGLREYGAPRAEDKQLVKELILEQVS
jgi:hypothetical protein